MYPSKDSSRHSLGVHPEFFQFQGFLAELFLRFLPRLLHRCIYGILQRFFYRLFSKLQQGFLQDSRHLFRYFTLGSSMNSSRDYLIISAGNPSMIFYGIPSGIYSGIHSRISSGIFSWIIPATALGILPGYSRDLFQNALFDTSFNFTIFFYVVF